MNKKDLKLIGEFIDKGNPKAELDFALVRSGGIYATDTRKLIHFNLPDFICSEMLAHKKVFKVMEGIVGKKGTFEIQSDGAMNFGAISISCNNSYDEAFKDGEFKYPDIGRILDQRFSNHFKLDEIGDILFELSGRNCFIESLHLYPLIEHSGGHYYDVFYEPQSEKDSGMVKIVASKNDEELGSIIVYTAVIMGREFKSQAKE